MYETLLCESDWFPNRTGIPKFGNTEILGRFRILKSHPERDWFENRAWATLGIPLHL